MTTDYERMACTQHDRASSTSGSKGVERAGCLPAYQRPDGGTLVRACGDRC